MCICVGGAAWLGVCVWAQMGNKTNEKAIIDRKGISIGLDYILHRTFRDILIFIHANLMLRSFQLDGER